MEEQGRSSVSFSSGGGDPCAAMAEAVKDLLAVLMFMPSEYCTAHKKGASE